MIKTIWTNIKNGRDYLVEREATDCTNERDGLEVIIYSCEQFYPGRLFVRDKQEFMKKFIPKAPNWRELNNQGKIVNGVEGFQGNYECLSNFYNLGNNKISIELPWGSDNREPFYFSDVETAFQACKCINKADIRTIVQAGSPGKAKRLGKRVKLRSDWEVIKDTVMLQLLRNKALKCDIFVKTLLSIPDDMVIAEMNYWGDKYWGVCNKTFRGENHLGKLLKRVRYDLKSGRL